MSIVSVREVMLDRPKRCAAGASVQTVREHLADPHVHVALLVDDAGRLAAVVDAGDLEGAPGADPAAERGSLGPDRVVAPDADLGEVRDAMARTGRRRVAVTDRDGRLLGLLALKRSGRGFCSTADVEARAADPSD